MRINEHYPRLQNSYLFARIGDVTRPLAPIVVEAMRRMKATL